MVLLTTQTLVSNLLTDNCIYVVYYYFVVTTHVVGSKKRVG